MTSRRVKAAGPMRVRGLCSAHAPRDARPGARPARKPGGPDHGAPRRSVDPRPRTPPGRAPGHRIGGALRRRRGVLGCDLEAPGEVRRPDRRRVDIRGRRMQRQDSDHGRCWGEDVAPSIEHRAMNVLEPARRFLARPPGESRSMSDRLRMFVRPKLDHLAVLRTDAVSREEEVAELGEVQGDECERRQQDGSRQASRCTRAAHRDACLLRRSHGPQARCRGGPRISGRCPPWPSSPRRAGRRMKREETAAPTNEKPEVRERICHFSRVRSLFSQVEASRRADP